MQLKLDLLIMTHKTLLINCENSTNQDSNKFKCLYTIVHNNDITKIKLPAESCFYFQNIQTYSEP